MVICKEKSKCNNILILSLNASKSSLLFTLIVKLKPNLLSDLNNVVVDEYELSKEVA